MFATKSSVVFCVLIFTIFLLNCQSQSSIKKDWPDCVSSQKVERVILLPGGALRGSFPAGVLDYLIEKYGLDFQMVTGVSVGAFNGLAIAQNQVGLLSDLWLGLQKKEDVIEEPGVFSVFSALLFGKTGVTSTIKLETLFDKYFDMTKLRTSGIEFWVGVVDFQTNQYVEVNQTDPDFEKFVLASAAIPGYFSLVEIRGHQYADGGLRHMISYMPAFNAGAKEIIAILPFNRADTVIPAEKKYFQEKYDNVLNVLIHTTEIMMNQTYKTDIAQIERLASEKGVKIIFIEPELESGKCAYGVMEFDKEKIAECFHHGVDIAQKIFPLP